MFIIFLIYIFQLLDYLLINYNYKLIKCLGKITTLKKLHRILKTRLRIENFAIERLEKVTLQLK